MISRFISKTLFYFLIQKEYLGLKIENILCENILSSLYDMTHTTRHMYCPSLAHSLLSLLDAVSRYMLVIHEHEINYSQSKHASWN